MEILESLTDKPEQGTALGNSFYKIRLAFYRSLRYFHKFGHTTSRFVTKQGQFKSIIVKEQGHMANVPKDSLGIQHVDLTCCHQSLGLHVQGQWGDGVTNYPI